MKRVLVLVLAAAACDPPKPAKTSTGESVAGIVYEETSALSTDVRESSLRGETMRRAVALMDKHGVFTLSGHYEATGVLDKSTLTLHVKLATGGERTIVTKNCGEPHLCAFFADAAKDGIVEKTPVVCRDPAPCTKK